MVKKQRTKCLVFTNCEECNNMICKFEEPFVVIFFKRKGVQRYTGKTLCESCFKKFTNNQIPFPPMKDKDYIAQVEDGKEEQHG